MNKTVYIIGGLVLVIIVGILGFLYYRGMVFSKQILSLEIKGPSETIIGQEVEYTVIYKNNGNFVLEKPKIYFELPDNAINEDSKTRFEKELENIEPGVSGSVSFKGILIGKQDDEQIANAALSYIPHNLSVRYESDATFTTKIKEVPIDLNFNLPSSIEPGKVMSFSVNYVSNVDYPLENLSIKIDPLSDFSITSASPASLDKIEWKLGTLNKGDSGKIRITGTVANTTQDHITFAVHIGMWQQSNFIVLKEFTQDVELIQPDLLMSETVNGSPDYQPSYGERLRYDIQVKNGGTNAFKNLFVVARLDGSAYDLSTIQSDFGQFSPGDNLIMFDSKQILDLRSLDPGEEVTLSFSVKLKESSEGLSKTITNKVNALGFSKEFTHTIK